MSYNDFIIFNDNDRNRITNDSDFNHIKYNNVNHVVDNVQSILDLYSVLYESLLDSYDNGARTSKRKKILTKEEALYLLGFDEDEFEII